MTRTRAKKLKPVYIEATSCLDPYDQEVICKRKVSTRVGIRETDGKVYILDHGGGHFNTHHPCAAISIWYKLGELMGVSREDARELLEQRFWRSEE